MFKDLFNTLVDVAAIPLKLTAKIVDDVIESETEDYVDELKDTIKIDKEIL